jgi:hypothetical protein
LESGLFNGLQPFGVKKILVLATRSQVFQLATGLLALRITPALSDE